MENIEIINYIKAPASNIYKALTTEKGLASVWTPKLKVEPKVGFINEFDFNEESLTRMRILQLEPSSLIVWECIDSDPEWVGTKVSFSLKESGGVTTVLLKHLDWKEISEYYRWCNYNWSMFLMRLKAYCEQ